MSQTNQKKMGSRKIAKLLSTLGVVMALVLAVPASALADCESQNRDDAVNSMVDFYLTGDCRSYGNAMYAACRADSCSGGIGIFENLKCAAISVKDELLCG